MPSGYALRTCSNAIAAAILPDATPLGRACVVLASARSPVRSPRRAAARVDGGPAAEPVVLLALRASATGPTSIARARAAHLARRSQAVLIALRDRAAARRRSRTCARGWPGRSLGTTGVLYTIPSLALFALLAPFTGIGRTTVLIGLVAVRPAGAGPQHPGRAARGAEDVRDAARGLGYGRCGCCSPVELPVALPAIMAGVRLATVSTVALVTVGVVVGYGGLGQLMFRGFRSLYHAEIMTATLLCVALALVLDLLLCWSGGRSRPGPRTARRA